MKQTTMFCNPLRQLIFSLTGFLLISFQANAQQGYRFADTSAVWQFLETTYSMFPPFSVYTETRTYSVAGDTVVVGYPFQIIQAESDTILVIQDLGRIQRLYNLQQGALLYDFALNVGDSFDLEVTGPFSEFLYVDSVDTVYWGKARKRIFLSCNNCVSYFDEVWVEGIGNIGSSFFWPFTREFVADAPTFELLCYSENGATVYQNPDYHDCFYDTVIYLSDKNILEEQVSIYPNPVSDFLFIDLPQHEPVDVCLSSVLGVELFCEKHSGNTSIDMRLYPASIYLLQIKSAKGSVSKRIVLER